MRTVDVYFDYSSPFAYLGTTQIERVARETGGEVRWKPFLLGALFHAIGSPQIPLFAMPEPKQRYQRLELERWAAHWGVPFRFTTHFPLRTVDALRLTMLAPPERTSALVHRLMRAAWVDDEDLADRAVLARAARDAGVDEALLSRTSEPEVKQALVRATDEAIAAGCPGAPCFVVDGELYWGQDRLHFVRAALEGRPPGASA
jgi:2-hydroxychromene-2-carboxylate isomerase